MRYRCTGRMDELHIISRQTRDVGLNRSVGQKTVLLVEWSILTFLKAQKAHLVENLVIFFALDSLDPFFLIPAFAHMALNENVRHCGLPCKGAELSQ